MTSSSPLEDTNAVETNLKMQNKVEAVAFFDEWNAKIVIQKFGQDVPIDGCIDKYLKKRYIWCTFLDKIEFAKALNIQHNKHTRVFFFKSHKARKFSANNHKVYQYRHFFGNDICNIQVDGPWKEYYENDSQSNTFVETLSI